MFSGDTDFSIKFFGWAKDDAVNADKIWGWVEIGGKIYNFWGRRTDMDAEKGRRLKFKRHDKRWGTHELQELTRKKLHPGRGKTPYRSIPCTRDADGRYVDIEAIYKDFGAHFKKQLFFARLTGTIMGEEVAGRAVMGVDE